MNVFGFRGNAYEDIVLYFCTYNLCNIFPNNDSNTNNSLITIKKFPFLNSI